MADSKITALTAISTVDPTADPLVIVDVSDTSMAASGTTKKSTINQLLGAGGTATLASATITGDLTVDTNVLKVDTTNNRVGIGTASPTVPLYVTGNNATATAIMQDETNGAKLRLLANSINFDLSNGGGGGGISVSGNNPIVFQTNGSEQMRLNSTGLGVGVVPAAGDGSGVFKAAGTGVGITNTRLGLDVREITSGNAAGIWLGAMNNENTGVIGSRTASGNIAFQTFNGASWGERMRIDYLGNVGIGVTPSAWGGSYKALQLQSVARNIAATGAGLGDFTVAFNAIYDSTDSRWEYAGTGDKAGRYSQTGSGNHRWFVSNTAGTAGNEITDFASPAMTLDASGNLLVGTTSSPAGAKVGAIAKLSGVSAEGTASINVSTTPVALSRVTGTSGLFFVMGYNASGGAGGWYLVASTGGGTPTVISSGGTPGLTLTFTMVGGQLNAQTASGTFVANAFAITA